MIFGIGVDVLKVERIEHVVDISFFPVGTAHFKVFAFKIHFEEHLDSKQSDESAMPNDNLIRGWLRFRIFPPIIWSREFCSAMREFISNLAHKINSRSRTSDKSRQRWSPAEFLIMWNSIDDSIEAIESF